MIKIITPLTLFWSGLLYLYPLFWSAGGGRLDVFKNFLKFVLKIMTFLRQNL